MLPLHSQNKYTATANNLLWVGRELNVPTYTLYQRERMDAPDPLSMFWYDPETEGDWWSGLNLDHSFTDGAQCLRSVSLALSADLLSPLCRERHLGFHALQLD